MISLSSRHFGPTRAVASFLHDEWSAATARSGEPWTPAEEDRLRRIYRARRKVVWLGRERRKPMYAAAKALKRTPCACAQRMGILLRIDAAVNIRRREAV